MSIVAACLWCGTKNEIGRARMHNLAIYCRHCGHRADKAKARCDCRQCLGLPAPTQPEDAAQQASLFDIEDLANTKANES
jgi:hypothetical protein